MAEEEEEYYIRIATWQSVYLFAYLSVSVSSVPITLHVFFLSMDSVVVSVFFSLYLVR